MSIFMRKTRTRRPVPYYVRWYESAGWYTLLKCRNFDNPEDRDRFARKLPRKPEFIRYA